jgi:hypothetical protein
MFGGKEIVITGKNKRRYIAKDIKFKADNEIKISGKTI